MYREIVDALNFRSTGDYLFFGLEKKSGTWIYIDGTSVSAFHWYPGEPGTGDDAAWIYVNKGHSYDLLTYAVPRSTTSSYWYALCEYNCE